MGDIISCPAANNKQDIKSIGIPSKDDNGHCCDTRVALLAAAYLKNYEDAQLLNEGVPIENVVMKLPFVCPANKGTPLSLEQLKDKLTQELVRQGLYLALRQFPSSEVDNRYRSRWDQVILVLSSHETELGENFVKNAINAWQELFDNVDITLPEEKIFSELKNIIEADDTLYEKDIVDLLDTLSERAAERESLSAMPSCVRGWFLQDRRLWSVVAFQRAQQEVIQSAQQGHANSISTKRVSLAQYDQYLSGFAATEGRILSDLSNIAKEVTGLVRQCDNKRLSFWQKVLIIITFFVLYDYMKERGMAKSVLAARIETLQTQGLQNDQIVQQLAKELSTQCFKELSSVQNNQQPQIEGFVLKLISAIVAQRLNGSTTHNN